MITLTQKEQRLLAHVRKAERETYDGKVEIVYKMSCGQEYPTEYWDEPKLTAEHGRCRACAIVEGRSRANVLTQAEVAKLFVLGIDDKRSGTDNYGSSDGTLLHYRTIEAIRTHDGVVIGNGQCWSGGFASCSIRWDQTQARLPLTTLREALGEFSSEPLREIRLVDSTQNEELFAVKGRFFLSGSDGFMPYLVELNQPAETVADALIGLMPPAVFDAFMNEIPVTRQGELWFVKTDAPTDDEMTDVPIRAHYKQSATTKFKRVLVRSKILGTNHTAGESVMTTRGLLVRGSIRHQPEFGRPEHRVVKLEGWALALRNTAKASFRVERRGGGGRD